jgi:1,4-dihydroxy-2-naphthoyl-CoA hydrolase
MVPRRTDIVQNVGNSPGRPAGCKPAGARSVAGPLAVRRDLGLGRQQAVIFCYDYVMQNPPDTQPGPDTDVDLSAKAASRFQAAAGLVVDSADGTRVTGHINLGPDHHTPWGVVHGGVYATAIESAASLGASLAVRDRGQFAVGVHNATDFLRAATSGRAEVIAEPLQQGRVQQLWLVTITGEGGKALARGQLRLQNVPLPGTGTS